MSWKEASADFIHPCISNTTLRRIHSTGSEIAPHNLMLPVFVQCREGIEEIPSIPDVFRYGVDEAFAFIENQNKQNRLKSVLVFGVAEDEEKDVDGSLADSERSPVLRLIKKLAQSGLEITTAADVCLCTYTSSGHCGYVDSSGVLDLPKSVARLAEIALSYANAGADIVAPSDCMDGRILAIKNRLIQHNLRTSILSYSSKFCSAFYGPFRAAARSKFTGNRSTYQLPPGSRSLPIRAAQRDVQEGADMLMVKPALPYLDILREVKQNCPNHSLFAYQVSGECAMLWQGAKSGAFDLEQAVMESVRSIRRAGADVVISYFVPRILEWIRREDFAG